MFVKRVLRRVLVESRVQVGEVQGSSWSVCFAASLVR